MRQNLKPKITEAEPLTALLSRLGIRPTRQRLALASLLFEGGHKHVTAEQILIMVRKKKIRMSLATVYNNLHNFTQNGLLREILADQNRSYFDTNMTAHHHYFDEVTGDLFDVPAGFVQISGLPKPSMGRKIGHVEVVLRLVKAG